MRSIRSALFALPVILTLASSAADDAAIARIERLPRSERIAAYETLADSRGLSDRERTDVVRAFAKHAAKLSPVFGTGSRRIDVKRWTLMLEYGLKHDPKNRDMLAALCQILIDEKNESDALPVARAFAAAYPDDHAAKAWAQWASAHSSKSSSTKTEPLTFPLHFCVLTRNPAAQQKATRAQCLKEVEILNDSFRTVDGKSPVRFVFKGFTSYDDVRSSSSAFLEVGDSTAPYDSGDVVRAFNTCNDSKIRDPKAINVYIIDSHSQKAGYGDKTSHGTRNSNRPYVLIDWERLGANIQNAEVHEMGHAFGLGHVGVLGARGDTSTNIMTSAAEDFGSGGKRDLGFSESQTALILYHAERTHGRLGLR